MPTRPTEVAALFAVLAISLTACGRARKGNGDGADSRSTDRREDVVCPSIAIPPHASLRLGAPLAKAGTYDVTVEADGQKETCTLTVRDVGPSQKMGDAVGSPPTRTESTCKLVNAGGIDMEGRVANLSTSGTPKEISLRIALEGKDLVSGRVRPDYTPDECQFVKPVVDIPAVP